MLRPFTMSKKDDYNEDDYYLDNKYKIDNNLRKLFIKKKIVRPNKKN